MSWLQQIFSSFGQLLKWWFVVLPWERAIRVRLGKHVVCFEAGLHFQIPFIDRLYVQNIRRRIAPIHAQTITTKDGRTVTLAGCLSYVISDIVKLYQTLHQAEATIMQHVQGLISEFVVNQNFDECSPQRITEEVDRGLDLGQFGLAQTKFFLTDFAAVRTYRLLNDGLSRYAGDELDTEGARAGTHVPY